MNEKIKSDDKKVLLVTNEKDGNLKAVAGLDKEGKIKTVNPIKENEGSFLKIDKNSNVLENFFKNFMLQVKNPKHTGFYALSMDKLEQGVQFLEKLIRIDPNDKSLASYKVAPQEVLNQQSQKQGQEGESTQKNTFQPFDENRIDKDQLKRLGVKWEDVEPNLKAMLYGHKSPQLIEMRPSIEGIEVPTKGRLSLEETPDGSLRIIPHFYQQKPELDAPFHGVLLTPVDKEQLLFL